MKVLVIGDGILDHYCYGLIRRQSPEDASIPVVDLVEEEYRLGGAFNVATNLKALLRPRKDDVYTTSIMSNFTADLLKSKDIMYDEIVLKSSATKPHPRELIKTRIIESEEHKQIIRLDNRLEFTAGDIQRYKNKCFFFNIKNFDAVVVSDYNKGIIDKAIIEMLTHELVTCPIFIDTKNPDMRRWEPLIGRNERIYFKVNDKEWAKIKDQEPQNHFRFIVTRGQHGATFIFKDRNEGYPTSLVERPNVVGAGDAFLAGFVVKHLETDGADIGESIDFANKVASKSVQKFGTCEVKRSEIYG